VRTWLPLAILALLILLLFPLSRVDFRQKRSIPWGGQVVLVSRDEGANVSWLLLATLCGTVDDLPAQLVIGATTFSPDKRSGAILLGGGNRSESRIEFLLEGSYQQLLEELHLSITAFPLSPGTDLPRQSGSPHPIGLTLIDGFLSDGEKQWPLPDAVARGSAAVRYDRSQHKLWRGIPEDFEQRWQEMSEEHPGLLIPYIEERIALTTIAGR